MEITRTLKFVRSTKGTHLYASAEEPQPDFTLYIPKRVEPNAHKEISLVLKAD